MSKQRSGAFIFIIASALLSCVLAALIAVVRKDNGVTSSLRATTNSDIATPTLVIHNERRKILKGASPQEVGEYVIKEFAPGQLDPNGPVDLVLARSVTRSEIPMMGLGCMHDFNSIEDPPLMLIILRGDFANHAGPDDSPAPSEERYKYAGYTVDVWAAWPARLTLSHTGGLFRKALNDPGLPVEGPQPPTDCPGHTPGTLPHGAEVPGIIFPTHPPEPTPTYQPVPTAVPTTNQ